MSTTVEYGVTTCTRKSVTREVRVEIEPTYSHISHWAKDESRRISLLEDWAKELEAFFRDHRSMDVNSVRVVRDTEDVCSFCNESWEPVKYEPDAEAGESFEPFMGCACCGAKSA